MTRFPVDVPKRRVVKALENPGFKIEQEQMNISLLRINPERNNTPLTVPNHPTIKSSTLRTICTQAGISHSEFIEAYKNT